MNTGNTHRLVMNLKSWSQLMVRFWEADGMDHEEVMSRFNYRLLGWTFEECILLLDLFCRLLLFDQSHVRRQF